eukprot:gnl/TRDRNA2_/TRDRNA2_29189_c0_seq1.p1 gnl/TRDRNA2_/TRDRNA2_29189_c0~~gnl/TRDRNA2_/TRDRNA2_29189_c0_seq1.p1  ORF type:complete len:519 (-),score=72.42 gnl/TRDRNA2_/TRDRNA2_29189_c0_seq1:50-1468(-)
MCDAAAKIGIVTLQTPDNNTMSYANSTEAINSRYAKRWGYGFHVVDHIVDHERLPHWSKMHAVSLFLPEYEYLLWIDADACFFNESKSIEEAFDIHARPRAEMWAQDIWPDFPSVQRHELIDTGVVLFRSSRWTRQFLLEMYHLPGCQMHLNWTEQYCFTVAYREDFLGMRERMEILPTPQVNHHILPSPRDRSPVPGSNSSKEEMFILHLAGRPAKARAQHFAQVHDGRAEHFQSPGKTEYEAFWHFRKLFKNQSFASIASLQACVFGIGARHRAFLDALLFHFPYLAAYTIVLQGTPRLWSQMKATEQIGERFPDRMAHIDVREYMTGETRDGDRFVESFFCDIFIVGVESWIHLPHADVLGRLAYSGLEPYDGADKNAGFGYSAIQDAYFVYLLEGCQGGEASLAAAASTSERDGDDEADKLAAHKAACELLASTQAFASDAPGAQSQVLGNVALTRAPRTAFAASART